MKCPRCEHENPADTKFCTSCGAPLGEATTVMRQATPPPGMTQQAPPPGAPQATTPLPAVRVPVTSPPKTGNSRTVWIVALGVIALIIIVAVAVGVPLIMASRDNPVADITSVKLLRADGKAVDMDEVPLDTDLVFSVAFNARYKSDGSGILRMVIADSNGETVDDADVDVKSGSGQNEELDFIMEQGSGRPLTAKATLTVKQGGKQATSSKSLEFTMVAGKGGELMLEEATGAATKKCEEATNALKDAAAAGVDVSDLADRLSGALNDLRNARSAEEADAVAGTAQGIIDECGARKAAAADAQNAVETCRRNQAEVRRKLLDWWSGNGNFPDDMSELYNLPVCPSGGTYSYFAPSTDPSTLHVYCSAHGEL